MSSELRAKIPDLIAVYLFGSTARGDSNPESDVDVAVLCGSTLPGPVRFDLEARLEERLRRSVDLVDLRTASAVFRVRVLEDAILIADIDPARRAVFECFALANYARLNEERAAILSDVKRTGRVHG